MSPLTTTHLRSLLRSRVRAFIPLSRDFTLVMVSSPGFGSFVMRDNLSQLGIAFTTPSDENALRHARYKNSPAHSSIGTTSYNKLHFVCLLANSFSNSFIPLPGCFSPFPRGTSSLSVDIDV